MLSRCLHKICKFFATNFIARQSRARENKNSRICGTTVWFLEKDGSYAS